ncbi:hypothetical protein SNE40_001115 [Patella caerulea]|uniref:RGS domain-containing protein n=1 Tax=Patella caerulea TaxID=87958 RepID=A0AAN8KGQ6_PATCE
MGVHLEEPSSPLSQPWASEDLNDFMRQMTNPTKHRMSSDSSSGSVSPTSRVLRGSRKSSLELPEQFNEKCTVQHRYASRSSRSSTDSHSKSLLSPDIEEQESEIFYFEDKSDSSKDSSKNDQADDGICDVTEFTIKMSSNEEFHVTFTCESSQEGSDCEAKSPVDTKSKKVKESKKGRFRKMIPRPLRRSHSAGCAKDIPSHALFLQYDEKNTESMESRRSKSISDQEQPSSAPRPRIVHKTSSADAAMMATEEFGAIAALQTTPKPKSRSIAKNVKRKLQLLKRRHTDSTLGSGIKHIHGKNGSPSANEVAKWAESFDYLLSDKYGIDLFKEFLHSEFSEENLEFWLACEQYKSTKTNKLASTAQKIYTEFVAAQAPKEINLDAKTRGTTLSNLTCPNRHCFQDAQKRVQALMEKDSYPRFLESDIYQRSVLRSQNS